MAKITETTPKPVPRSFSLDVNEEELKAIRNAVGRLNSITVNEGVVGVRKADNSKYNYYDLYDLLDRTLRG